ncbi:MAG: 23S rRNA (adenine(2503)-C(2))-methyltransferase RlmN [Candidatus Moraniibacteriota bacterium]|nr:MAG: 23S rRNA (adenine(2503)-C(2))-methyltransferase RlmN [Candidatus Moranbacteria bacterium]
MENRIQLLEKIWPEKKSFREKQFFEALFSQNLKNFDEITVFPKDIRILMQEKLTWLLWDTNKIFSGERGDTHKAILSSIFDGAKIETVLMKNARGHWTICVSSQVGCAMKCSFCATGSMGFIRNLNEDEIVDQYRFWKKYCDEKKLEGKITNIVFMGMGEPLANYKSVKRSIDMFLSYADIGATRITVSTVGLLPMLEKILTDKTWPNVRLAVSLHSADEKMRNLLMPSSYEGFLKKLSLWAKRYFEVYDQRRRHLTFEYVLLGGVNDTEIYAEKLLHFSRKLGKVRVNLIPYNATDTNFQPSQRIENFREYLRQRGVVATVRKSMGQDIAAACGQLVVNKKKNDDLYGK